MSAGTPPKGPSGKRAPQPERIPQKPEARKPGHAVATPGDAEEEHVAEAEHRAEQQRLREEQRAKEAKAPKTSETKKARDELRDRQQKGGHGGQGEEHQPKKESTTAGMLAHNANFAKGNVDRARNLGFQQTPGLAEIISGKAAEKTGESLGELLPMSRMRAHPSLPDVDLRPPIFLSPLEAMGDIYMRTRGRMSPKTKDLLSSPDLEDLLSMLRALFENEELSRKAEARLIHPIWSQLKDDPGPMLLAMTDPRLTEPWRLFLDKWEIWVPDDEEEGGVELFWEGEGEDDDGQTIELLQSLMYRKGELVLYARLGKHEDRITFDGETFYRLKSDRPNPPKS